MKRPFLPALSIAIFALSLAWVPAQAFAADPQPCEKLASLKLPDTTIASAMPVAAGDFTPPGAPGAANAPRAIPQLPSFCRVQLTVAPSIRVEVWLPATGWNGNFEAVGGNGYAGAIVYPAMANALKAGYATASTDTGHQGGPEFALGHPDLAVDYGYRGIHEMTIKAKQVIEALYGMGPRLSFFNGCSTGGRQGLTEAQRYPEDYNGILAGAPAIEWPHLMVRNIEVGVATLRDEESYIPASKLAAVQDASVAACDGIDGVKDGLVDDPRKCNFDPSALLCKQGDSDSCLSAKQVEALKHVYAAVKYPDGRLIYPAYMPGTEKGWNNFTTGASIGRGGAYNTGLGYMKYFVFNDPNWDLKAWNLAEDTPKVDKNASYAAVDSMNTDLRAFRDHGGKLIVYQGWGDDAVSPLHTINYYKAVVGKVTGDKAGDALTPENANFDKAAEQTGDFMRLFMIPGMNHCGGGSGPNVFNGMDPLANWVAKKQAPQQIVATHMTNGSADRTRPLCPYPQTAQYSGQGSIDDAANFSCKMPAAK